MAWPAMRDDVPVLVKSRQRYRKLAQQMAGEGGIRRCLGDNKNTLISSTSIKTVVEKKTSFFAHVIPHLSLIFDCRRKAR